MYQVMKVQVSLRKCAESQVLLRHQIMGVDKQGSQRLEKYLNIQDCLEKSVKIIFVLKCT